METQHTDIRASFDDIFRAHYPALCRYAYGLMHSTTDAEEIVQNVFVKLWEQGETLEVQHIKAYLYRAVYTRSLNYMRDKKKHVEISDITEQVHTPMPQPGAEAELQKRIKRALDALPTECRRVFELSRFEELKYREIAAQLQISVKTVETQMGKALRIMRLELADYLTLLAAFFIHLF